MKALYITKHGPVADLTVSEVAVPARGPDEVKVRVEAAGINPSDLLSVKGSFPESRLPRILGRDFAGTVVEGPSDLVGVSVWGTGGDLGISRNGTHAEQVVLPRRAVSRRPRNVALEEAGSTGLPFVTAFSALERARTSRGEVVLVTGAAGAVGSCAIQLARARGASVIALVKDATQRSQLRPEEFLAIAVSEPDDLLEVVKRATGGRGCDVALNALGAGVFKPLVESLAEHGRMVVFSAALGREATLDLQPLYRHNLEILGVNTVPMDAVACAAILEKLTPLFEAGSLHALSATERFPLSQAPRAYAQLESGKQGKLVLLPNA